jgi:integrase/recombinase XerD
MLSNTISNFLTERAAIRYSPNTIRCYRNTFDKLLQKMGDPPIENITRNDIIEFLNAQDAISAKTLRNYHADLSALWQWAMEKHLCGENIIRTIRAPIADKKEIIPFAKIEVLALLKQVRKADNVVLGLRNVAIIYLLLDTGIRASELCGIKVKDINKAASHITVMGKGRKERNVPISTSTMSKIIAYISMRNIKTEWAFTTVRNRKFTRDRLGHILHVLGLEAGVTKVYPHRFRHTFAIQFLRNGGNIYSLQKILGHTTLDMVKRYLAIAQIDLERDHAKASPVEHWIS